MKKILLIDNTFDPPHGSPEIHAYLESGVLEFGSAQISAVRAPLSSIPADVRGFDAAVLSGSKTRIDEEAPWIEAEQEAIRQLYSAKIPTLGICYGEQLIAKTLGGAARTGVGKEMEHGWAEIEQVGESLLLAGLPQKFFTFQNHKDEVRSLPENFRLTARNGACSVQAYELTDAPIYGVQFHPERGFDEGNRVLDQRLAQDPAYPALNRARAKEIYDPRVALTIFRNFLASVWKRA